MFKYQKKHVIIVKDKKIIAYKSERTKKIAYNLRMLLTEAVMQEWDRLRREKVKNKSQAERIRIENERSDLYRALDASICICPSCNQCAKNMVYNATLKEWYCSLCVQEYREYYQKEKTIYGDLAENSDFYETFL